MAGASLNRVKRGLWLWVLLLASTAMAERRHAVVVGANVGWAMDQRLRHAHDDAERFAATLIELGQFAPTDVIVLRDPSTDQLLSALAASESTARSDPGLFVFYYSGHSDAQHLHLQGTPLTLETLSTRLKAHPARVKVGIFDSCQSGSLLAAKGGRPAKLFDVKVDDALAVQGTAILASSGADELSQEARALQGSYFTHHLISALRGAADDNHDGRVALAEAWAYASNRTTLDTLVSEAGAQRPVYRFDLKGRGDVMLTQLAGQSATLQFSSDLGRCFVTDDSERRLIAEVPQGADTRLLLPAGPYLVKCPTPQGYRVAALTSTPQGLVAVKGLPFREQPLSAGVLKGGPGANAESPTEALKQQAVDALRAGQAEQALGLYDQVLASDLRDTEAYRGKAQAYLLLAQRAGYEEADRLRSTAVRLDPTLADDPEYRALVPTRFTAPIRGNDELARQNMEAAYPHDYQSLGVGLALIDAHGPFSLSLDWLARPWLQFAAHFNLFSAGAGLSGRVYPRSGSWSPYFGLGGNVTLAGLGLTTGPNFEVSSNGTVLLPRTTLDRLVYLEGGIQFAGRHVQLDLGVAMAVSFPLGTTPMLAFFPAVAGRWFF